MGAGVVMTQAWTLVLSAAPETRRARILSLFQLGLMSGAPVGALLIGYLVALAGRRGGLSHRVHVARAGRAAAALPPLAAGAGAMRRDQRVS